MSGISGSTEIQEFVLSVLLELGVIVGSQQKLNLG